MPSFETAPDSPGPETSGAPKKRGCLVVCLIFFFVVIPVLIAVLNGPGFRILTRIAAVKAAESQGLSGGLKVDGTLWSGFSLSSVEFDGLDDNPSLFHIEEASLRYRGFDLLRNATSLSWLDAIVIRKATLVIPLPGAQDDETPASSAQKKSPAKKVATRFNPLWNLLESEVEIDDLSIDLLTGDEQVTIAHLNLKSVPGEDGYLRINRIAFPGSTDIKDIDAKIVKGERRIEIGAISPLPFLTLNSLSIEEPKPGQYRGGVSLAVAGGVLEGSLGEQWQFQLNLKPGTGIDLAKVELAPDKPLELTGKVTALDLGFAGDFASPKTWSINGNLLTEGVGWQNYTTDTIALTIAENQLHLEAIRADTTITADISAPFQQAETPEDLQRIPIDIAAKLEVPSLESALKGIADELPLTGAVSIEARDFQLRNGKELQSGSLLVLTENVAWDDVLLSGVQFAANVESPNQLRIAGDAGLDLANRVQVLAGLDLNEMTYTGEAKAELNTAGRLGEVLATLGTEDISGRAFLNWKGNGNLKEVTHAGAATVGLEKVTVQTGSPITGEILAHYEGTSAAISKLELKSDERLLSGTGNWDGKVISLPKWRLTRPGATPLTFSATLPFDPAFQGPFLDQPGDLSLELETKALALSDVTCFFAEKAPVEGQLNGSLTGKGSFNAIDLAGDFEFTPEGEGVAADSLVKLDLGLTGDVDAPESWNAKLLAHLSGLRVQEIDLETISLAANTVEQEGDKWLLAEVDFNQSSATLDAKASLLLEGAVDFASLAKRPLDVTGALVVEKLESFLADFLPGQKDTLPLSGSLHATLNDFRLEDGSFTRGKALIQSDSLAFNDQVFEQLSLEATISKPDQFDVIAEISLDDATRLSGNGGYHLKDQTYSGDLNLIADLSPSKKLKALLSDAPASSLLPLLTQLEWKGKGAIKDKTHEGDLNLKANRVTLATGALPLDLKLEGTYSGTAANFPVIEVSSQPLDLEGALRWEDKVLYLDKWSGRNGGREILSLNGSLPLDPEKLTAETWFDQEAPVDLSVKTNALAIESISRLFMEKTPINGDLTLDIKAGGSPKALALSTDLLFDKIVVPQEEKDLPVGRLNLDLVAENAKASVNGKFEHPDINPFMIEANLPFLPADWAKGERKLLDESITASAKMEKSSLAFLTTQVPGIESIVGTIALDASLKGSLAKPSLSGSGFVDLDRLKMEDRNAPSLRDMDLVARFEEDTLVLESLKAIVAGGIVEGSGRAKLVAGEEPDLDFRLTGQEVLIMRNPDVSVRTDADVSIRGPWSTVAIGGELGITNSRYFKNFDLLPVGLPTRNKSVLPTMKQTPRGGGSAYQDLDFGVAVEPFKNWPVNLRIHTKDPFLVRSNLVESALNVDLTLSGTLGAPVPTGYAKIDEGELSLPFSSVDVETGTVEFDASTGFNGALEFKARAKSGKYTANIYLFNRVLSPKYVLTSNPPLPSEDIMTLLATGSVRSDLVGDDAGSVAASKAAKLFLKNIRKSSAKADQERSLLDSLEERTELELGGVNPETGDQTFGGKIRLWKQLFFVGDVDKESDYRALLKYVFRFR